jgi:hypothetical protein
MSFTPNFTTYQLAGTPGTIYVEDISTGSDAAIVSRRVYLTDYEGNYVVPSGTTTDYIPFPLAPGNTIAIDCLTEDMALNIVCEWLDVADVPLYTKSKLSGFTAFNETFYYSLTQGQAAVSNPSYILQDNTYFQNKSKLRVLLDSGNQAIVLGYDITSAQNCYDLATFMTNNQNLYF